MLRNLIGRNSTLSRLPALCCSTALGSCAKGEPGKKYFVTKNEQSFPNSLCYHFLVRRFSQGASESQVSSRIAKLVKNNKVVIFMKGVPDQPMCGFSNAVVQVLRMHGVENYDSHNVLEDEELRQGIKDFSDWPTIPQVYFEGEFIGGCDILLQMHQSGELIDELKKLGIDSAVAKE